MKNRVQRAQRGGADGRANPGRRPEMLTTIGTACAGWAVLALAPPLVRHPANRAICATMLADEPPQKPNSLFALYDEEELAGLWDVHTQFFSERDDDVDESAAADVDGEQILGGGLHADVLRTIAEAEAEMAAAAGEDASDASE